MSDWRKPAIVGGLSAFAAGLAAYGLYRTVRSRNGPSVTDKEWRQVGVVSRLFIHPVKACRGMEIAQAECTALGMRNLQGVFDRHYIILDNENNMVTMRQKNALALIQASPSEDLKYLQLDAPDMPTCNVPLHESLTDEVLCFRMWRLNVEGLNCGKEVAQWLDTYLKTTGYKLVCYTSAVSPKKLLDDWKWGMRYQTHEQGVYQDLAHFHLFSEASLDDLNGKLENNVDPRNFRPNFVVSGPGAFEEDDWKYVRIGTTVMRATHLCGRCKQTTVDPETGVVNDAPLKMLKEYRMTDPSHPDHKGLSGAPVFGINLNIEAEGAVAVGDAVYASY